MVSGALGEGPAGGEDVEMILELATSVAEFVFDDSRQDGMDDEVASLNIFREAAASVYHARPPALAPPPAPRRFWASPPPPPPPPPPTAGLGRGVVNWGPAKVEPNSSSCEDDDAEEDEDEEGGTCVRGSGRKSLSRRAWYKRRKKAKVAAQFVLSQVLEGVDRYIDQQDRHRQRQQLQQQHYHHYYQPAFDARWSKAAAAPVCWGPGGSLVVPPPVPSPLLLRRAWRHSD